MAPHIKIIEAQIVEIFCHKPDTTQNDVAREIENHKSEIKSVLGSSVSRWDILPTHMLILEIFNVHHL
jgi:hypothetical protein